VVHALIVRQEYLSMALTQNGKFSYGDSQVDIRAKLTEYSNRNGYPAMHFADAVCSCGHRSFKLLVDDTEGAAVRECSSCKMSHPMGDSADYLADASLEQCECPCGSDDFEMTVGVALYDGSEDVRWIYIGCRCSACGLTACYGDWKNEFEGFQKLLANI
jgi:hypothetical protein